jgi:hypothetical protein
MRSPVQIWLLLALLCWLAPVGMSRAQLALPGTPRLPATIPQVLPGTQDAIEATLDRNLRGLASLRDRQVRQLLRRHRDVVDSDPAGAPVVRAQIVAIDPDAGPLQDLDRAGFEVQGDSNLAALQLRVVQLRAPDGLSTHEALALARRIDPGGSYDYNHIFLPSSAAASWPAFQQSAAVVGSGAYGRAFRVGLIDSAPDPGHPALAGTRLHPWGCGGRRLPDAHGTAVASLLAGRAVADPDTRATLYAADVYCGAPAGGAAVEVARALAWMARERVGVVNISLVGPPNTLLERAIARMAGQGHLLVAAVGNDGPAAPPLYPAAYPAVIGVAAVGARSHVLPESGRGPQVDFAAPGTDMVAAAPGGRWTKVRGTSYAAPIVARLAAQAMDAPGRDRIASTLAQLGTQAKPGDGPRDAYGRGVLGAELRVARAPPRR